MKQTKKITILHSNDLHGDFLAEQVDENLVGGVSMLSGYIEKVRAEEPNTIYAIAGDMFRGSVIDSEYKGLSTIEIMNALAPDIVTIGNHEVDYGIAHLLFIEKCARFPIINANLYIKNTPTRLFTPYPELNIEEADLFYHEGTPEVPFKTNQEWYATFTGPHGDRYAVTLEDEDTLALKCSLEGGESYLSLVNTVYFARQEAMG